MHKLLSKLFISNLILFSLLFESDIILAQKKLSFPKDWLGNYQGNLEMITTQGTIKIPMTLTFEKTESDSIYKWLVTYDSTSAVPFKVEKNYLIKVVSIDKGKYLMDEQNGIVLHMDLIDNTLYSGFSISSDKNDITLLSFDRLLKKGVIYHEIVSFNPLEDKEYPNEYGVKTSKNHQVQKAILRKKK
jgi:hypothetical protein